jgi:hypothetical protein
MSRTTVGQPLSRPIARFLTVILALLFTVIAACGDDNNNKSKNPVPVLTGLSPTSATVGDAAFTLTVTGSGFEVGSTVNWSGAARATTFVSSTQLTAAIPAADLGSAGTAQVTVVNAAPGGGTSPAMSFLIAARNPVPVVTSLSPASIVAGSAAFELSVNGSDFLPFATVQWNGVARPTTFVSGSVLRATIAAADVATAGTAQVRVVHPVPGSNTSASLPLTIQNAAPVLSALNPSVIQAGSQAFTLTVTGAGFVQGAQVQWAGADRATTFLGATQLSVAISAADVAQVGSVNVTVRNPAPTVGPSNALQFAVTVVPAPPPSGYPVRITIGLDGSSPNGPSVNGGMDWDGNHVIFASKASNLAAGDSNDAYDLFIRDTCNSVAGAASCTPATRRIVMAADGSQPNGDSGSTATSPENSLAVSFFGRHVAFVSSASNLVAGDTNGVDDVYFKTCLVQVGQSACTPAMVRASVRADGSQSPFPAGYPAVAEDGRYVLFVSADPNMVAGDANGVADVFLRDTCVGAESGCTPSTTRVSAPAGSGDANGASGEPVFTGRYVAFTSTASNLVPGDTNGVSDVFLHDTCIGAASACTPSTERISVGIGGEQANGASFDPQVSYPMAAWGGYDEHGRFVAFTSAASNLVAGDTNGATDVFERDTCRWWPGCVPSTTRVSVTSTGAQIDGASWGPDFLRWDGETLPFVTAANGVVPEDTNGVEDVYVRHACPFGAPDYCVSSTARYSVGTGGVQLNGASFAPRLSHDPWGAWLVTFISEATNVVAGGASPSGHPSIYMIVR